jgi:hypothetical protein
MNMSFEIKYDRDGTPLKQPAPEFKEQAPIEAQEAVQAEQHFAPSEDIEPQQMQAEEQPEQVEPEQPQEQPRPQQQNFKSIRDRAERAEAELRAYKEQQRHQAPQEENLDINIEEDALAEGKHLNKVQKKLKAMENQLKQYQQQSHLTNVRSMLKDQFPDFDKVLTQDNLDRLNETEPEIAYSLNSTQDPYTAGVSAYKMIKKMGIYEDKGSYNPNIQTVQKNAAKPRPVASLKLQGGDSPLTHANAFANGLTPDLQKNLYKEMQDAIKRG